MQTATVSRRNPTSAARDEPLVPPGDHGKWMTDIGCKTCAMVKLCSCAAIDAVAHERLNDAVQCVRAVGRGQALYRRGDTFGSIYAIRSGSFKTVITDRGGHEQVTGFGIVGDALGIDGIAGGRHSCEAIALEDSSVCVMPFGLLELLCREVKTIQRHVHQMLGAEIVRESALMMLLGTSTAEERVATFLADLSQRWQARGYSAAAFILKMTREEIGSHLGLTLETVSRMLSTLHDRELIEVHGKNLRILDLDGLQMLAADGCISRAAGGHASYAFDARSHESQPGVHQ